MNKSTQTIAAFDFDGTLTYRDTTLLFLIYVAGPFRTLLNLFLRIPKLAAWVLGKSTRQKTKESIFNIFFKGMNYDQIRQLGEKFARDKIPKHLRPDAMEKLQWHQQQGHRCVLISASLDVYLESWAQSQGFEAALTSRLAHNGTGTVDGSLIGLNCRREEKVRRLKEYLGGLDDYEIYAYGDSQGDKELLAIAHHPFLRGKSLS